MINPAPGFDRFSTPWGPRRVPGALGRAQARKRVKLQQKSAPETNSKARPWALCVFGSSKTYPYPRFLAWGRKPSILGI